MENHSRLNEAWKVTDGAQICNASSAHYAQMWAFGILDVQYILYILMKTSTLICMFCKY